MKFYMNLLRPVRIGERELPPLFEHSSEGWRLRPGIDRDRLLEPFLSNHLDESLNPSRYRFSRGTIRSRIRARCRQWAQFYADRTLTKAPITPADQAEAYFLLVTNRLSKTTGQVITVDGGLHEAFLR
jgi:hypothetical protein